MTNAQQDDVPTPRGKPVGVVMLAVGALMLVGGEFTGYWIGAIVAVLGAIVLVAGIIVAVTQRRARRGAPPWRRSARLLLGSGVAMAAIGLIGGGIARWSASRRLLTSGTSQTINARLELTFPEPDYTVFWVFMIVVALGAVAILAGIRLARAQQRTSDPAA